MATLNGILSLAIHAYGVPLCRWGAFLSPPVPLLPYRAFALSCYALCDIVQVFFGRKGRIARMTEGNAGVSARGRYFADVYDRPLFRCRCISCCAVCSSTVLGAATIRLSGGLSLQR